MVAALPLVAIPLRSAQAIPAPWPGLPSVPAQFQWYAGQGNGVAEVARARQWARIPAQAAIIANTARGSTHYPADDPQGRWYENGYSPRIFLSSPSGSERGYGEGLPTTVRTVAFGAIPVEARIQLEQLRDASGLPVPLEGYTRSVTFRTRQQVRPDFSSNAHADGFRLSGKVDVRVTRLSVDGVGLAISAACQAGPVELDLKGKGAWDLDPLTDPRTQDPPLAAGSTAGATWMATRGLANVEFGGAVTGSVVIPPFTGCKTTSGDDVSRLLTAAVSGPGNQVTVGLAALDGYKCGSKIPPLNFLGGRAPYSGDPSDCDPAFAAPKLELPARAH